jgi:DNA-binding transcriptional regulator YbjK
MQKTSSVRELRTDEEFGWTRWSPIRTVGEVVVEFVVVTRGELVWQRVEGEVRRLRGLGTTLQAIGRALGVDEKTVRNVLAR